MRIAIPIEIAVRELDAKIYLSLKLAKRGHNVYLGKGVGVGIDLIDPDIYISKRNQEDKKISKETDITMMLLDEEGGFIPSTSKYTDYSDRIYPERLERFDYYLAWGQKTADIVEQYSNSTKVIVTGNPRFDLLQKPWNQIYKEGAKEINERFGKFVLINTNFPIANHSQSTSPPQNYLDRKNYKYTYVKETYQLFLEMVRELSRKLENVNIIVRPHPSEKLSSYQNEFKNCPNVQVIHEGDARKWISAAHVVIHNNCTTGVEAALMKKKVYSYDPIDIDKFNSSVEVPKEISIQIGDIDELLQNIEKDIQKESLRYDLNNHKRKVIKHSIDNIEYLSADKIVNFIESIDIGPKKVKNNQFQPSNIEYIKRVLLHLNPKSLYFIRDSGIKTGWSYDNQTFPYFSVTDVQENTDRFSEWINTSDIRVERVPRLENTFHIYSSRR